jgi:hypothetical protein
MLWLRRLGNSPLAYTQSVETDDSGRFNFKGPLSGMFSVTLGVDYKTCTYRPIGPVKVPADLPITIELCDGAAVSGRVIRDGKPVDDVVVRVRQAEQNPYSIALGAETRTDDQGRFRILHLGEQTDYYAFTPLDSLSLAATMAPRRLQTGGDATTLDLGEIEVGKGCTLAGRVILSDRQSLAPTTEINAQCLVSGTAMSRKLDSQGHFTFEGLPEGPMAIYFSDDGPPMPPGKGPLAGYHLSAKNKAIDARTNSELLGTIGGDVTDLTILVEPGEKALVEPGGMPTDFARLLAARRDEAKTRPLVGVALQSDVPH